MQTYLALLRGINVGGNSMIKMTDLKAAIESSGLEKVRTYIQSGNLFFESAQTDTQQLAARIEQGIQQCFQLAIPSVVFTQPQWKTIVQSAPEWWGKDADRKHNLFILVPPYDINAVEAAIGTLDPAVETIEPGEGVLYQSLSRALQGRMTTSRLANSPLFRQMTIRNYNTATKLLELF